MRSSATKVCSLVVPLLALAPIAGCKVVPKSGERADSAAVASADTARSAAARDSAAGIAGTNSLAANDSGTVILHPAQPQRGGVLFVLAEGVTADPPRCTWKGASVPCHRVEGGVRALIPLPADEAAGSYTLTIDRPNGRIVRQVAVADREFDRELVFLDSARHALLSRARDISRDARAMRQVLAGESEEQRWQGAWRDPVQGSGRSSEYGVERFYYRASDSARAVTLRPSARARGTFAGDTAFDGGRENEAPAWRHSGVDIASRRGNTVRAPAGAIVTDVGDYVLTGRTLILDHGQGVHTAYFHLDTVLVRRGDVVRAGATVGRVGNTGLATGPHLHYGIYLHGKDVDPAAWRDMPAFVRGDSVARVAAN
ncbi:MAG: M23 family metallopeptidase [Gemmatimonadaceae bacterium]